MKRFTGLVLGFVFLSALSGCKRSNQQTVTTVQEDSRYEVLEKIPENSIKKIICLSPAGAEILCALGEEKSIIGRSDFCDYPEEMKEVASVGGFSGSTVSIEKILMLNPDFVYGSKGIHDNLIQPMKLAGIKLYLSDPRTIEDVCVEIKKIGKICGRNNEAQYLATGIENDLNKMTVLNKTRENPLVYYEVWNSPYMTCGCNSFINDLIKAAGGKNAFDFKEECYPVVNEEAIIAAKPDFIIIPDSEAGGVEAVMKRPGWENIPAVKNHRVFVINADIISRPGPRVMDAVREISSLIH